ncbi:hypothetical protein MKX01_001787 [Papaver californicum]|nr:hypothetical protein MKX01_001787 [Papaver californicum]
MISIHDISEMPPDEKEQVRKNLKLRKELIRRKLILTEIACADAGREFKRDEHKITEYYWLLMHSREMK